MPQAQQTLVVGVPCLDNNDCRIPEAEAFFKELYSRSGLDVKLAYLPMLRDITEANAGVIDASMSRTEMATKDFSNLVRVPYPLFKIQFVAVTAKPGVKIGSWEDLRHYNVGIMRGGRTAFLMAEKYMVNITLLNNWKSGFAMLREGRVDALITSPEIAETVSQSLGLFDINISEPIMSMYTYHYLNKKHAALAPGLARSLKAMLEDGTTKRLFGRFQSAAPTLPLEFDIGD